MGNSSAKVHSAVGTNKSARLDIIHFNDVYNLDAQYTEDPIGGAARFMTVVEELRAKLAAEGRKPLLLFSGDFVGPSLMSTITQGAHLIDAFNLLKVDYATFGNHEFDYGYESLVNRLAGVDSDVQESDIPFTDYPETQTKWLMTNMSEGATGKPVGGDKYCSRTALVDWPIGPAGQTIKVGLLAVSADWLKNCSQLKKGELVYEDFIQSATSAAAELRGNGAQIVLALTHSRLAEDKALTAAVPAIDLMLGGHDHFYRRDRSERIVKGGEEWRWVTHLMADIDPASERCDVYTERYDVYEDIPEHPAMKALVDKYNRIAEMKFTRVLCSTDFALDPTEPAVRFKESAVANWVCDMVAADYSVEEGEQRADIAIVTGFTFAGKQVMPAGDFTLGDLMTIFPRPESIVAVKLSGADVVKSLTLGVSSLPRESGAIHHVNSRLTYTVVIPEDRAANPVVKDVLFDGAPIDLERMYSVSTTATLAKGKFGYSWFATAEKITKDEDGIQIQDLVKMYCEKNYRKPGDHKIATAPTMNRIQIVNE